MYKSIGGQLLTRSLKSNFEKIVWAGADWSIPEDQSIVVYSNHHSYYDGYLAWWFFTKHLGRPYKVWMEDFDRFPQFGPLGAMSFPKDDARERAKTIRKSAELLNENRGQVIHFMPEGELSPPQSGIGPFLADLERFDRIFSNKQWLPFVMYTSWDGGPNPIAFLAAGESHEKADGSERTKLMQLLKKTEIDSLGKSTILMEGTMPTQDRWNFSFAKNWFKD